MPPIRSRRTRTRSLTQGRHYTATPRRHPCWAPGRMLGAPLADSLAAHTRQVTRLSARPRPCHGLELVSHVATFESVPTVQRSRPRLLPRIRSRLALVPQPHVSPSALAQAPAVFHLLIPLLRLGTGPSGPGPLTVSVAVASVEPGVGLGLALALHPRNLSFHPCFLLGGLSRLPLDFFDYLLLPPRLSRSRSAPAVPTSLSAKRIVRNITNRACKATITRYLCV